MSTLTEDQYRAKAKEIAATMTPDVEIDEGATVSTGDDPGAWVQVWLWVQDAVA